MSALKNSVLHSFHHNGYMFGFLSQTEKIQTNYITQGLSLSIGDVIPPFLLFYFFDKIP